MKVGILCGVATIARKKALLYARGILDAGHFYDYFIRAPNQSIDELYQFANQSDCEFFITCNDNLGSAVSRLNESRGWNHISPNATHKTNLKNLPVKLQTIPTWEHIDEVPKNTKIIIKPNHGSGSQGGEPWSYQVYDSIDAFTDYLINDLEHGLSKFEYAQTHVGTLGKSIFQQYIENDGFIVHQYLNDGVPKLWMTSWCNGPMDYDAPCTNVMEPEMDLFDGAKLFTIGTFGSLQAFPDNPPLLFDFNVRDSAYWTSIYQEICPNFYSTFFNNLLNKKQETYDWRCKEFTMVPNKTDGLFVEVQDYPRGGMTSIQGLILN